MRRAPKHHPKARTSSACWRRRRRFNKRFSQMRIYPLFRLLPVLWLLLCYCCCCCHCAHRRQIEEQSAQLNNCYDMQYGFDRALIGIAPELLLPSANSSNSDNGNEATTANNSTAVSDLWTRHPLHDGSDSSTQGYRPVPATHTGWQCCCWNATNQDEIECHCVGEALMRVPQTLTVPVQRLSIASAGLPRVRTTGLKKYAASLQDFILKDLQHLECIEDGAFDGLKLLRTIYISNAPKLMILSRDVFRGISETIKIIRIINSGLIRVPDLRHIPPANILQMIDLDNNEITRIDKNSINVKTDQLILANNEISYIDDSAFNGSQIAKLTLRQNRDLKDVHPNAFNGISIHVLDLSGTSLVSLPPAGLQDIEELRIEDVQTLKTIPSIYNFKNLQRAFLTHSFHCCAFIFPSRHDPQRHAERMKEIEKWQQRCKKNDNDNDSGDFLEMTTGSGISDSLDKMRAKETENDYDGRIWGANGGGMSPPYGGGVFYSLARTDLVVNNEENEAETEVNDYFAEEFGTFHSVITINPDVIQTDEYCGNFTFRKHVVECYPMANALNPCEDVMGYQWLRISVWIVVTLAVVGNVAVLVVFISIRSENPSVPRFLMGHLAFADLCLGLYLLLIAAIDAHSMGAYFNYAYDWQYGAGCKAAGFLTVFASHLSVFTLTVITIERWMAITQAMHLNKRIKLRAACYIMAAGWVYSIVMSLLPLFGISNYSSTSICLPMEISDSYDTAFLVVILGSNGMAFTIITICYAQMYRSLGKETRHAHSTHRGEMTVAKKMALLVFTNFSCWAPIAFFGLTALAGYPLINVTKSKILLVFFYPLNSCADPYLYALLTSQYRADLYALLSRIFPSRFGICKKSAMKYKNSISAPYTTTNVTVQGSSRQHRSSSSSSRQAELQLMLKNHEEFV
ncbi:follicle-stimulating hormone receptor isoform X2 [Bactrocera neohumeralis]|uniref:follicle-stimulating hormone receptor isoform X2 n=1 Tax=Bactrocera neohumeralis TaxID=98809 RepID=UPI002165EF40|nr:follicle-stimulating hormone receptor isoform X2 [Bactrocera neohumeralis]